MSRQRSSSIRNQHRIKQQQWFPRPKQNRSLRFLDSYLIEMSSWAPSLAMLQQTINQPSKNSVLPFKTTVFNSGRIRDKSTPKKKSERATRSFSTPTEAPSFLPELDLLNLSDSKNTTSTSTKPTEPPAGKSMFCVSLTLKSEF